MFDSIHESLKIITEEEDFKSWLFSNIMLFTVVFAIMTTLFYAVLILISGTDIWSSLY